MCCHPLVASFIADLESGKANFQTIKANESISLENRFPKTFNSAGNIIKAEQEDPKYTTCGYIWKELSDFPIVIGITLGCKSDHDPHLHKEAECYYVWSGRSPTLCCNKFIFLEKGDYFYIPGCVANV